MKFLSAKHEFCTQTCCLTIALDPNIVNLHRGSKRVPRGSARAAGWRTKKAHRMLLGISPELFFFCLGGGGPRTFAEGMASAATGRELRAARGGHWQRALGRRARRRAGSRTRGLDMRDLFFHALDNGHDGRMHIWQRLLLISWLPPSLPWKIFG